MNRFLITTTTAALALSTSALVAVGQTSDNAFVDYQADAATELFASDLVGARIYATEAEVGDTMEAGSEQEWDNLGEINDMILSEDGSVQTVILGIGGFLGIGERDVAVDFSQIQIVRDGDDATDYFLVVNATQEEMENAPEFERSEVEEEMEEAAEKTGEAMDEAATEVDQAADAAEAEAEETANEAEAAASEAANEVDQAADAAEAELEETANEAEAAASEAANEVEQAAEGAEAEMEEEMNETETNQ
ncbi:PRC-barrel domain-containing protein [Palleronia salina]|uniref:PRC-barrel domain-containing protein n=1 Tax=Palleronia salina TaxID=313368 RepID=A0A1M6FSX3_9RHOB|nr:PRC-barrel domain-containing protein [Palleronia salina]SHJ00749.1 PRC-barrel domain-containing protein [Palleronia salina]